MIDRPRLDTLDREHRVTRRVDRDQARRALLHTQMDPQLGRAAGVKAHTRERERNLRLLTLKRPQCQPMQRRVKERRVNTETLCLPLLLLGQRHLDEHLLPGAPCLSEPLERGPILIASLSDALIELPDIELLSPQGGETLGKTLKPGGEACFPGEEPRGGSLLGLV